MKNENIVKINKIGKVSRIFAKILMIVAFVVSCMMAVLGTASLFIPDDAITFNGECSGRLTVDESAEFVTKIIDLKEENIGNKIYGLKAKWNVESSVDESNSSVTNYDIRGSIDNVTGKQAKFAFACALWGVALYAVIAAVVMGFAAKLCQALENCESPFEENVITKMKNLSYALIPVGIIYIYFNGISALNIVLPILVILMLSAVFKYGAQLQKESDETL